MDTNLFTIIDDEGNTHEMEIVLTFENEETGKAYVLFTDPKDEEGNVYCGTYTEDGDIEQLGEENEEELAMCEEVLGAWVAEQEGE